MIDAEKLARRADIELEPLAGKTGYRVIRGEPRAGIYYEIGEDGVSVKMGIWECTEGAFETDEKANELQCLIEGRLVIVEADGIEHHYRAGDSFFTFKDEKLIWDVRERVRKIFYSVV